MGSSKPLFVYWDLRALGEPIRLLLHYLEVDFEEQRIPQGEPGPHFLEVWTSQKFNLGLDFPNLPYYVEDGLKITQSFSILQYLARKHNLYGESFQDQAKIDMAAHVVNDFRLAFFAVATSPKFPDIKDEWKKTLLQTLGPLNKYLEGKEYVIGSKISYVDFLMYEVVDWVRLFAPDLFEDSPELADLNQFQKRIANLPQIKAYLESDKFKEWPIFPPFVYFGHGKDPNFKPIPFAFRDFFSKFPLDSS